MTTALTGGKKVMFMSLRKSPHKYDQAPDDAYRSVLFTKTSDFIIRLTSSLDVWYLTAS